MTGCWRADGPRDLALLVARLAPGLRGRALAEGAAWILNCARLRGAGGAADVLGAEELVERRLTQSARPKATPNLYLGFEGDRETLTVSLELRPIRPP